MPGQSFDATGLEIWANYSDGTKEQVTVYTVSNIEPLTTDDISITVSGTYKVTAFTFSFDITVAEDDPNAPELVEGVY